MGDKTALSYWFPKLVAACLPLPKTILLPMPELAQRAVWAAFDGNRGTPQEQEAMHAFIDAVKQAADYLGFPCFLRTDHTSGKHGWGSACFLPGSDDFTLRSHVYAIAEYSVMAGFMGLPFDTWAVREMLPTIPHGVCTRYGNMPICREFRFFVQDDEVKCVHPYWPREALRQGGAPEGLDYEGLCRMDDGAELLYALASAAGRAVGGAWSVDLLETTRGWFITDMAEAEKSFHWKGCPNG